MAKASEFPDWTDDDGNPVVFTAEEATRRLAPLAERCPAAHVRLMTAFTNKDLMGFIKAFRRLSDKRQADAAIGYAIGVRLLPPPPGAVRVSLRIGPCRTFSAAELEEIRLSALRDGWTIKDLAQRGL